MSQNVWTASIIQLQRNYHPCWVGWELLSCTPWPSVYLLKQLFYISCYSWTIWMWVTLTDTNFNIYYPLLSQAWLEIFHLLTVIFRRKIQQLRAGWLSPSTVTHGYGVPKGGNTDPLPWGQGQACGNIHHRLRLWFTLWAPSEWSFPPTPADYELQSVSIHFSYVTSTSDRRFHLHEACQYSSNNWKYSKHGYITGQTLIIFKSEEHCLEEC